MILRHCGKAAIREIAKHPARVRVDRGKYFLQDCAVIVRALDQNVKLIYDVSAINLGVCKMERDGALNLAPQYLPCQWMSSAIPRQRGGMNVDDLDPVENFPADHFCVENLADRMDGGQPLEPGNICRGTVQLLNARNRFSAFQFFTDRLRQQLARILVPELAYANAGIGQ